MKWLFCDLDGSLADSLSAMQEVLQRFLRPHGVAASPALFDELNGSSLKEIVETLKDRYALEAPATQLLEVYNRLILDVYGESVTPMAGSTRLLADAQRAGYQMLLVTAGNPGPAQHFVRRHGWEAYFSGYVFGDEVSLGKPAPDIYRLALRKANAACEAVSVLEDSPSGVKSAKAAGLFTIGLVGMHGSATLLESGADRTVSTLDAVLPLVNERAH